MSKDAPRLTARQFSAIRALTYQVCGINLHEGKENLVQSRLSKRVQLLGFRDFDAYLTYVEQDRSGRALSDMIDALTTNKTSFFRESRHFDFLADHVFRPAFVADQPLRLWSAGCSSGEEPYSLAIHALEIAGHAARDVRILATDVSTHVLARARTGVYEERQLEALDAGIRRRRFLTVARFPVTRWQVRDNVRALVRFARLNLMDAWPMNGPFDVILCRNVMIYFDKATQERLVQRFSELLSPDGYLFVGHSESLTGMRHSLRYVQPAVYVK